MATVTTAGSVAKAPNKPSPRHLYLVDGSGYIFRAYHALPPMNRKDGTPTNAVFGYSQMLMKLIGDTETDYLVVVFDAARKNFRNALYSDYKANRPEAPDDLVPQFALIRDATRAFNVACVELDGYEADDLIATYAKAALAAGDEVTIVSSDKDLMQLVCDGVTMLDPIKQKRLVDADVREKFGVDPCKVLDVLALAGDASDNVPGVPGIGVKTAAELINTYGDLDTLLARAGEIKQPKRRETLIANADKARLSRDLVRLEENVPGLQPYTDYPVTPPQPDVLLQFLRDQEFNRLLARVGSELAARGVTISADAVSPNDSAAAGPRPERMAPRIHNETRAAPPVDLTKLPEAATYPCVRDEAALMGWIEQAREVGHVAITVMIPASNPFNTDLCGIALAVAPGTACYVPLGHRGAAVQASFDLGSDPAIADRPRQIEMAQALALLKPLLEDPGVLKIGHNIKLECQAFANHGIALQSIDDAMMLSYVLDAGAHSHGLDELADRHLGHALTKVAEVIGSGRAQIAFDQVTVEKASAYAARLADVTLRLHRMLKPRLASAHVTTVYETLERPLIPVLQRMEQAGIKVDRDILHALSGDFGSRMHVLEQDIYKLAGREFNVGSPKQLGEVLFDEMSLGGGKKGKTGAYATGADILEELAAEGHDLPARVLEWRQISKLKSTYTEALQTQIDPKTGRVHTSYGMAVASTGRLSSTDPNLQNIPIRTAEGRKIRRAFIAEPGHQLISADYSQIELRLLAHVADIPALKAAFRDGADIHALTASEMFGVPLAQLDSDTRRKAKAINFGIIYGISAFGLANQLGIPQGEAAAYIKTYFERYPGIRAYMEATKSFARANGFVRTIFGRKIHVPWINQKNAAQRSFAERAAINAPLQGAAADIIKRAMIRIDGALKDAGLKARMLLQVHDELVFEAPAAEAARTADVVRRVMCHATLPVLELSVPLMVETGIGDNWSAIH